MTQTYVNSAIYSAYGAFEQKAKYQLNFLLGTLSTLSLVLLILLVAWIISSIPEETYEDAPSVVITTIAELGPPPSIAKSKPQLQVAQPNVAAPKVGIPKPVADDEVMDEDVVLATREELAEIVAPDITASDGGSDIVVDISDDDYLPSPDEFVAVEIQPEMIYKHKPSYPRLAEQAGIEGNVWVKALVAKDGDVVRSVVAKTSGTGSLDDAAVEAALKCKFKPGIQNGRPIAVWVTWKYEFTLEG